MNGLVILRRARISLLFFLVLICLTWAALFALFLSHEWSYSSPFQKVVIVGLLSLFVFTAILLYLMAVIPCCPWRDVKEMFAILVVHIGSSVLFTHYRPSFPCQGYDTETACKELVFMIFIGSWAFSGITLCTAIALGVMALIPRPVEPEAALESLPLTRTEEGDLTSNSDLLKAGSLTNERRTSPSPIYTGLPVVTYNNGGELPGESLSPDRNTSLVNSIHREIITPPEPPHLWQGFRSKNSRHGNENRTRAGTISTRNTPGGSTSIGSVSERADPFRRNFLSYSPTSRVPIHSRASMIRPAVGRKNTPAAAKVRPNRTPTFPKPLHIAQSPIPLRNSPFPVTVPRDRVTEYSPTVFSVLSNDSILTPPWDDSQPTYPDHARTTTYNARSLHSIEEEPTPYALLPSVPSPRVARFQDLSAFWGPKDISSGNNASFATGGSNAPLIHSVSQPRRIVQRSGVPVGTAHRASMHPVKDVPLSRRGSDGQELDQTQWWGLVRSAATKP